MRVKSNKFYADFPSEMQRSALEKLAPLKPIANNNWYFQDVMKAASAMNPTYTDFLYYSRRPPTLDKLVPWATTWGEDQDLRDILESFQDQSQVNT